MRLQKQTDPREHQNLLIVLVGPNEMESMGDGCCREQCENVVVGG